MAACLRDGDGLSIQLVKARAEPYAQRIELLIYARWDRPINHAAMGCDGAGDS